jgi:hypothetical protein
MIFENSEKISLKSFFYTLQLCFIYNSLNIKNMDFLILFATMVVNVLNNDSTLTPVLSAGYSVAA